MSTPSATVLPPTATTTYPPEPPSPSLPPWPQVDGACGSTAFLPIVSAAPLDEHTGIRAVVGDRLRTVDVDSGTVTSVAGLPRGQFAGELATAGDGRYALLTACQQATPAVATVVRLDASGARPVARGPYSDLLSGGDHVWGAIYPNDSGPILLDPLDGRPRLPLPNGFAPLAGSGDQIIGTMTVPGKGSDGPFLIRRLDPVTGRASVTLGPASSVAVSAGLVVWTGIHCVHCPIRTYDLATGAQSLTRAVLPTSADLWSAVVSPDHRMLAFLEQRSTPARYDMDHPGNPNEIVVANLDTGAVQPVPGVTLWSKSFPGLAFSGDGRWLAITLDEGTSIRVLVWRPGLDRPLSSAARLDGKVAGSVAIAVV